jgi:hypothetical protein
MELVFCQRNETICLVQDHDTDQPSLLSFSLHSPCHIAIYVIDQSAPSYSMQCIPLPMNARTLNALLLDTHNMLILVI